MLFWFLSLFRFLFRVQVRPEGLHAEKFRQLVGDKDVIFVLPRLYLFDVFLLGLTLKRLDFVKDLRLPLLRLGDKNPPPPGRVSLVALRPRPGLISVQGGDSCSHILDAIMKQDPRVSADKIVCLPVSVFWSRHAEQKKPNVLSRILFADDAHANLLQKILSLLLHGRNIHLHFGKAISMAPDASPHAGRRLRRYLLIEFNKERTAALGPNLYEREAVANDILTNPETIKMLKSLGGPLVKQERKVLGFIKEIAADYSFVAIDAYERLFALLWTRIFKGVRIRNFTAVSHMARGQQIVWMPCHRSHLDYLLLSYVLVKKGLTAPHVAAGVNLAFWPMGFFLRRGGAFFMRRSFSGNKLYAHVFAQYVHFLMKNSFPLEFFQEGGRSRIGKLLFPKTGLLSIIISSIISRKAANTVLVPVYFGYDRVMEDSSYAKELSGAAKNKENFFQFLASMRRLFSEYGQVDVSFGPPVRVGDLWTEFFSGQKGLFAFHEEVPTDLERVPDNLDPRDHRVHSFVKFVATRMNQGINSAATANASALLASVLLSSNKKSFSTLEMKTEVAFLGEFVEALGGGTGWNIATTLDAEENQDASSELPRYLKDAHKWEHLLPAGSDEWSVNDNKELHLWWYRGSSFHVLAPLGIVAHLLVQGDAEVSLSTMSKRLGAIRHIWRDELFWPDSTSHAVLVTTVLQFLARKGLVRPIDSEFQGHDWLVEAHALPVLKKYARLVRSERESYGLQIAAAAAFMESQGGFNRDQLLRQTTVLHRAAFLRGKVAQPAQFSKVYGSRVFEALSRSGLFSHGADSPLLALSFTEVSAVAPFFGVSDLQELALLL